MENIPQEIAKSIKHNRKEAGLSQAQLAELAGIGKTVVFDIEHGKNSVQFSSVLKLLKVLNIKLEIISPLNEDYE